MDTVHNVKKLVASVLRVKVHLADIRDHFEGHEVNNAVSDRVLVSQQVDIDDLRHNRREHLQ